MPNVTLNAIKDFTAVLRVCLYRIFWEHSWSAPQAMFNMVDVAEGMETTFEAFLAGGQSKGAKNNTCFSFGPYRVTNTSIYIYVTNYGSTAYFLRTIVAMSGSILRKRFQAAQRAVWAYYHASNISELSDMEQVTIIGIVGDATALLNFLKEKDIQISTLFSRVVDVRGKSAGTYFAISDSVDITVIQKEFSSKDDMLQFYDAKKIVL